MTIPLRPILDLQARLAEVDEKLGASLNSRMLGALEAAVVPLAETMTKQMVELETRVCRSDRDSACESTSVYSLLYSFGNEFWPLCIVVLLSAIWFVEAFSNAFVYGLCYLGACFACHRFRWHLSRRFFSLGARFCFFRRSSHEAS